MDPTLGRRLILDLDYGESGSLFNTNTNSALTAAVPKTPNKPQSRGSGEGGVRRRGGSRTNRTYSSRARATDNTVCHQAVGSDGEEPNRGSKKRKQLADTDEDENEEEQQVERQRPILTTREQPVGIDIGMSGSGKSILRCL